MSIATQQTEETKEIMEAHKNKENDGDDAANGPFKMIII